jgi:Fe-S-cluster containining protein
MNLKNPHPCLSCGACCAYYRVSFHWLESLPESHQVPLSQSKPISIHFNAMNGTDGTNPRCHSLKGQIGQCVSCEIYKNRPECCRIFIASFENGIQNIRCDEARINKGLLPLLLTEWVESI